MLAMHSYVAWPCLPRGNASALRTAYMLHLIRKLCYQSFFLPFERYPICYVPSGVVLSCSWLSPICASVFLYHRSWLFRLQIKHFSHGSASSHLSMISKISGVLGIIAVFDQVVMLWQQYALLRCCLEKSAPQPDLSLVPASRLDLGIRKTNNSNFCPLMMMMKVLLRADQNMADGKRQLPTSAWIYLTPDPSWEIQRCWSSRARISGGLAMKLT